MATYIGNPDPPNVRITRPVGSPSLIGTGSVDDAFGAGSLVLTGTGGNISALGGTLTEVGTVVETPTTPYGCTATNGFTSELITLSTSTTVTTSTTNLLPANSSINAVMTNCVAAITGSTSYKVGDPTSDARFLAFTTSIGLNQGSVGQSQWNPTLATTLALSPVQVAATTVKITVASAVATAGQIRCTVFYTAYHPPSS